MPTLEEQTKRLATDYPIGCKVRVIEDGVIGKVKGYQLGAHIKRPNEVALTVNVPADVWVLYPDQVERVKEVVV